MVPLDEKGGSTMEVTQVFSNLPPGGYTAVRVSLKNEGQTTIPVTLSASSEERNYSTSNTLGSSGFSFDSKGQSTTEREFIIPLIQSFSERSGYSSGGCRLVLSVTAVLPSGPRTFNVNFEGVRESNRPFTGFSQGVAGKSLEALNEAMRNVTTPSTKSSYRGAGGFASLFTPAQLPSDWRGFMGLDHLAMTPEEWVKLSPGVTNAIRQWIILGGTLDLFVNGPFPAAIVQQLKPDRWDKDRHRLGAGGVRVMAWEGEDASSADIGKRLENASVSIMGEQGEPLPETGGGGSQYEGVIKKYTAAAARKSPSSMEAGGGIAGLGGVLLRHDAAADTAEFAGLGEVLGERNFAAWQVGVILLIFGVLVGPVNLFYFAGPGRRHRLFYTTPLISLGASLLVIVVILFQDGVGGGGVRAALMEIRPDDKSTYLRQYQISRTGVLFGGGFTVEEPSLVTPLVLPPSRWTRLKPAGFTRSSDAQRYTAPDPLSWGGDWFQSRSEQAQLVQTIRPGRGRLELKAGGQSPVIVSSLECRLEPLFYTDAGGKVWTADTALTTGNSVTLRPAGEKEYEEFLKKEIVPLFPSGSFDSTGASRFTALTRDPKAGFATTLKSIRWEKDIAVVYGPLTAQP
ncbi:MAG: hypothetical protein EOP86_07300 [Verrucomicrobiaceae bacterium]|nr:MAG: hypothetical protein EOP86_07300 [Verrucomicrobiaceae bacterium]